MSGPAGRGRGRARAASPAPGFRHVVTASRRTDMVRWYPRELAAVLARRFPPTATHTVVLVTKFPGHVLEPPLVQTLALYDQVFCHVTITGLGGTLGEPNVPPAPDALAALPALARFVGSWERIVVRLDPLVYLCRAEPAGGPATGSPATGSPATGSPDALTNAPMLPEILREAARLGVRRFCTSLMEPYPKVLRRLAARGLRPCPPPAGEVQAYFAELARLAAAHGAVLTGCCAPGLPPGACVDGVLLARLHPKGLRCRTDKAKGQRAACGCTHSLDAGWYTQKCRSGCLYCYATG